MSSEQSFFQMPSDSITAYIIENNGAASESVSALIKDGRYGQLIDMFLDWTIDTTGKLVIAMLIFLAGRWVINRLIRVQDRILARRKMDVTLQTFLGSISRILAYAMLVVFIINVVGTHTVSIAALIAAAGLAVGLAVKDNLANFAGGVMLLLNKPFKGGDVVEVQGMVGTVKSIGILYTMLTTSDNKSIYIPNGPLSTGNIINYNSQRTRMIEITVGVDYGSDAERVKALLLDIATRHDLVLSDPLPFARLRLLNQSSVDFVLRVWAKSRNYWPVWFDLNEEIYKRFAEEGINMAYPQVRVHLGGEE